MQVWVLARHDGGPPVRVYLDEPRARDDLKLVGDLNFELIPFDVTGPIPGLAPEKTETTAARNSVAPTPVTRAPGAPRAFVFTSDETLTEDEQQEIMAGSQT